MSQKRILILDYSVDRSETGSIKRWMPEDSNVSSLFPHSRIQTYINYDQGILGTQFHPEIDRETGNEIFLKDRELLEKNRYDVGEMIKQGPSFKTGNVFFGFFLEEFNLRHSPK